VWLCYFWICLQDRFSSDPAIQAKMGPFNKSTTQLPFALREELGLPEPEPKPFQNSHPYSQSRPGRGRGGSNLSNRGRGASNSNTSSRGGKSSSVVGRKEARKNARKEKKLSHNKPALKVIGKGISAAQYERQKKDGGTAKDFERNGKRRQREIDLDENHDDLEMEERKEESRSKKKNQKRNSTAAASTSSVTEPTSDSASSSSTTSKKRSRDPREDSSSKDQQRKHVTSSTQTPLEKMLAKAESKSSSKGTAKESARKKPRSRMTQMEKDEEDEIRWLEAKLAREKSGEDLQDDLDGEF